MNDVAQVYFGDWEETKFRGMVDDFEGCYGDQRKLAEAMKNERWQCLDVLFAAYTYKDYTGDAFVLFKSDGKLFEVNGGHCSCHGLSERSYSGETPDQWDPEETNRESIEARIQAAKCRPWGIFGVYGQQIAAALDRA